MSNKRKIKGADGLATFVHDQGAKPQKVVFAWCSGGSNPMEFTQALATLGVWDGQHGQHLVSPGGYLSLKTGPRVAEARSQIVDHFLQDSVYKGADWLLMVDDDEDFDPDLIERLLAYADVRERPIIGGLVIAGSPDGRQYPTVYKLWNTEDGHLDMDPAKLSELPDTGLVKVGATGAGCLLVHRWVLIHMLRQFNKLSDGRPNPYPWFVEGLVTAQGKPMGEDIAFCRKAMVMGIPIHVAMDVRLPHRKETALTYESCLDYERRQAVIEEVA